MQYWSPQKSWTAAVRGAVICGIEKHESSNLRRATSYRHSYAVCLDESHALAHHGDQEDTLDHGAGTFADKGQLTWLLNKGDLILSSESMKRSKTVHIRLLKQRQEKIALTIWQYSSDEEHRPASLQDATGGK